MQIENRARKMLELLWIWVKRFGSAMMDASRRYHADPTKQAKPTKHPTHSERRAARRELRDQERNRPPEDFDRRTV